MAGLLVLEPIGGIAGDMFLAAALPVRAADTVTARFPPAGSVPRFHVTIGPATAPPSLAASMRSAWLPPPDSTADN